MARDILEDREARLNLTQDIFVPPPGEVGLGALEAALDKAVRSIPVETKLRDAVQTVTLLALRAVGVMDARARGLVVQAVLPAKALVGA